MRMIISGRHLDITDPIRDYAEKKIGRIKKYFDNILEIDITLSAEHSKVEGEKHTADVLLFANGTKIKATASDAILYAAIDEVMDVLEKQVKKYKEKLRDDKHAGGRGIKEAAPIVEGELSVGGKEKRIVSARISAAKPMSVEEAVLQMEALGQEFYTFMNFETEELNIVYRRRDGDYGHIEPVWK